jgi:hypothetical protein
MEIPAEHLICDGEALCVAENSKKLKIFLATFAESMTPEDAQDWELGHKEGMRRR